MLSLFANESRRPPRRTRTLRVENLESRRLMAAQVWEDVNFETDAPQSLWAPGTEAVGSAPFRLEYGPGTISEQNLNGIIEGCAFCLPPVIKNGGRLSYSGFLKYGLKGSLDVTSGSIDVNYDAQTKVDIIGEPANPGDAFTIQTSSRQGRSTLDTDFSEINLTLDAFINARADAFAEYWGAGVRLVNKEFLRFSTGGERTLNLISANVSDNELNVEILGNDSITLVDGFEHKFNLPLAGPIGFEFASLALYAPSLDLPSQLSTETNLVGGGVTSTLQPGARSGNGRLPVDYAKTAVDLDAVSAVFGMPLGATVGIPGIASLSVDVLDIDLNTYYSLGQTLTFNPRMTVDLQFSIPTEVETSPGNFELVTSHEVPVGTSVNARHPGVDLQIDPIYSIDQNTFSNRTDLFQSNAMTASFLGFSAGGNLASFFNVDNLDFSAWEDTYDMTQPKNAGTIDAASFTMEGFTTVPGSSISLPVLPTVEFTASSQAVYENSSSLTAAAALSFASPVDVVIPFTIGGTASASDYSVSSIAAGEIRIPAGQTSGSIELGIADDGLVEATESIVLTMGTPTSALLGSTAEHMAHIIDNDNAVLSISDVTQNEEQTAFDFAISLDAPVDAPVSVDVSTLAGSATSGLDYVALTSHPVRLDALQTSATVTVTVVDDDIKEDAESFEVLLTLDGTLLGGRNVTAAGSGAGTILDTDNHAPIASSDSASTIEDSPVTVDVLANDSDVDGDVLTIRNFGATNGIARLVNSQIEFTPGADFHGEALVRYQAYDGTALSPRATLSINVLPVNDAPVARDDAAVTLEDRTVTVDVLANDTDAEGDALTLAVTDITNGAAEVVGGQIEFTPAADFYGEATVEYKATDGQLDSNFATLTIDVKPVKDQPVANDDAYGTDADTALNITAPGVLGNDVDADGNGTIDVIDFEVASALGAVVMLNSNGELVYDPSGSARLQALAAGETATDTFEYTIGDDTVETIRDVNQSASSVSAPALSSQWQSFAAQTSGRLVRLELYTRSPLFSGGAVPVTVRIYAGEGTGGTLLASGTTVFSGTSFNYRAVGFADPAILDAGNQYSYQLVVSGQNVQIPFTRGALGSYSGGRSNISPDFDLAFRAYVNGPMPLTDTASVSLTITGVNDLPVAVDDSITTDEDQPATIDVVANDRDVDGDSLTPSIHTNPASGTASVNADDTITYSPNANFHGDDSFIYAVDDGSGGVAIAMVNITVNPVNDAPIAADYSVTTRENLAVMVDVLASDSDVDGDPVSVFIVDASNGVAQVVDGQIEFTPKPNFIGQGVVTYRVNDGAADSELAVILIDVLPNDVADIAVVDRVLRVLGTAAGEVFVIAPSQHDPMMLHVRVSYPGVDADVTRDFPASDIDSIVVRAKGGDDDVTVDSSILLPSMINGGSGDDVLRGGSGNDELRGGLGNDVLVGGFGDDTLRGRAGQDILDGGEGDDSLKGGEGDDLLTGGPGNDDLKGQVGNDTLRGDEGRDSLRGGAGDDMLVGGADDDQLRGGNGDDFLIGEDGDDTLSGGQGNDVLQGGLGRDLLRGGNGNDVLLGQQDEDLLIGGRGNDVLVGGHGGDMLRGGQGADVLIGSEGADDLRGGRDDDILIGGTWLHQNKIDALIAVSAAWSQPNASYADRSDQLMAGVGVDGEFAINAAHIANDGAFDKLRGTGDLDWFWGDEDEDELHRLLDEIFNDALSG